MTEYMRLLNKDSVTHFTSTWDRHDTIVLVGCVVAVIVIVLFITGRK